MIELSKDERTFIDILAAFGETPATRSQLKVLADRKQDKVRQTLRRKGLIEYVGGYINGRDVPFGWRLTSAGRGLP